MTTVSSALDNGFQRASHLAGTHADESALSRDNHALHICEPEKSPQWTTG